MHVLACVLLCVCVCVVCVRCVYGVCVCACVRCVCVCVCVRCVCVRAYGVCVFVCVFVCGVCVCVYACSLVPRPSYSAALDVLHHQHAEGRSGEHCTVFVFSGGICPEPMGCEMSHDRPQNVLSLPYDCVLNDRRVVRWLTDRRIAQYRNGHDEI